MQYIQRKTWAEPSIDKDWIMFKIIEDKQHAAFISKVKQEGKQKDNSCNRLWNILSQNFKSYNVYQIYKWLIYHNCQSTYVRKAAEKKLFERT